MKAMPCFVFGRPALFHQGAGSEILIDGRPVDTPLVASILPVSTAFLFFVGYGYIAVEDRPAVKSVGTKFNPVARAVPGDIAL
jgi:hypothetical protein